MSTFEEAIRHAINCHSKENGSNTPDHLLADYLIDCLAAWDKAVTAREKWYGRAPHPVMDFTEGAPQRFPDPEGPTSS